MKALMLVALVAVAGVANAQEVLVLPLNTELRSPCTFVGHSERKGYTARGVTNRHRKDAAERGANVVLYTFNTTGIASFYVCEQPVVHELRPLTLEEQAVIQARRAASAAAASNVIQQTQQPSQPRAPVSCVRNGVATLC